MIKRHVLALLFLPTIALAQTAFPTSELSVDGIYARRANDPTLYCLLGSEDCLLPGPKDAWNVDTLIDPWLAAHPRARATVVSAHAWSDMRGATFAHRAYLWIEDEGDSLNVSLVKEGHYAASQMIDMVESDQQFAEMNRNPEFAAYSEQFEKERAETPLENRPHRLVSDATYAEMMLRIATAEASAKHEKKGIWSDAGFGGRSPPHDEYLLRLFATHMGWFNRINALVSADPRLADVSQASATVGQSGAAVDSAIEYSALLRKIGANEQSTGVSDLGELLLVVADITWGINSGVLKGYVFEPTDPSPLVADLDHWVPCNGEIAAYRLLRDGWYLFVFYH